MPEDQAGYSPSREASENVPIAGGQPEPPRADKGNGSASPEASQAAVAAPEPVEDADSGDDIIARLKAEWTDLRLPHHDVPGWGKDGGPLRVYYRALSGADATAVWDHMGKIEPQSVIAIVVQCARKKDGTKLFNQTHAHDLLQLADYPELNKLFMKITGQLSKAERRAVKKKSEKAAGSDSASTSPTDGAARPETS